MTISPSLLGLSVLGEISRYFVTEHTEHFQRKRIGNAVGDLFQERLQVSTCLASGMFYRSVLSYNACLQGHGCCLSVVQTRRRLCYGDLQSNNRSIDLRWPQEIQQSYTAVRKNIKAKTPGGTAEALMR